MTAGMRQGDNFPPDIQTWQNRIDELTDQLETLRGQHNAAAATYAAADLRLQNAIVARDRGQVDLNALNGRIAALQARIVAIDQQITINGQTARTSQQQADAFGARIPDYRLAR